MSLVFSTLQTDSSDADCVSAALQNVVTPRSVPTSKPCSASMLRESDRHWFIMRIRNSSLSRLETLMSRLNADKDIDETYAPMRFIKVSMTKMDFAPYLLNYVFVRSTLEKLKKVKQNQEYFEPLRFVMHPLYDEKLTRHNEVLIISDKKMDDYRRVTTEENDKVIFLDNIDYACKPSQEVQVTEGPFAGVVGRIKRIKGNRGVVIPIGKEIAVAIMDVPRKHMRLLTEEEVMNIEQKTTIQ